MAQTSFQLDDGTAKAIDELKGVFASPPAPASSVGRSLARIATRMSDDGAITLVDKEDQRTKVLLTV